MIKLYHKPTTRSQIVVWLLEEIGVPYELEFTDTRSGVTKSPGFLSINPMGKLPALEDGDVKMSETGAICLYLSDKYGAGKVAPTIEDPERAKFVWWMFYVAGCVEPAIAQIAFEFDTPPRQTGWGKPSDVWMVVSEALAKGPYLVGNRFTTADIYLGSRLRLLLRKNLLSGRHDYLTYVNRLDERENWKRAAASGGYREKKLTA
jgi:glutathione S-transferase